MPVEINKNLKIKLLIYTLISAISFTYLIMPENAGISVPLFTIIQFAFLWILVPDKKRLILFVPIFIISLNSFLSANHIWKISNFIISVVLYSCIFIKFDFKKISLSYFLDIILSVVQPIAFVGIPFRWICEINNEKTAFIKRILIAIFACIPCVLILLIMLSNADMIFSMKTADFMTNIFGMFQFNTVFKIICGIMAGLYFFGVLYYAHMGHYKIQEGNDCPKGDLIIINIILSVVLFIYTMFVVIQFKYLFAGSALPNGLTYTEYARKGFFELLWLSVINIAGILTVIFFIKNNTGKWMNATKLLCHYLCAVTVILLISSFYRMLLYTGDDGLTRLRFFVMGFLIFESIGLLITFVYIAIPKFNITLIYTIIALTYYCVLNIIPSDNIIAKNQIDIYLNNERNDVAYIYTLSADAPCAMKYLYENTDDPEIKRQITEFLKNKTTFDIPCRWQRYNLSVENAKNK